MRSPSNPRNVVAAAVFSAIGVAVVASWQSGDREVLLAQADIWAHGVVALEPEVSAAEDFETAGDAVFFLRAYHTEIRARYQTPGGPRDETLTFHSGLRSLDTSSPPELRYDPKHPERFAVSWTNEGAFAGWLFLAWKWLCGLGWVAGWFSIAAQEWKRTEPPPGEPAAAGWQAQLLAASLLTAVGAAFLLVVFLVAEDLTRRFSSYLGVLAGLVLGYVVLGLGFSLLQKLRVIRR